MRNILKYLLPAITLALAHVNSHAIGHKHTQADVQYLRMYTYKANPFPNPLDIYPQETLTFEDRWALVPAQKTYHQSLWAQIKQLWQLFIEALFSALGTWVWHNKEIKRLT